MNSRAIEIPAIPAPTMQMSACRVESAAMDLASVNTQRPPILNEPSGGGGRIMVDARTMMLQPRPEHEHRPKMVNPISPAGEMFVPHHPDRIWLQQPLLADATWVQ
jgi:hypothetical protein